MKPHQLDTMSRLSAADPARDATLDEIERARLWQLIAATPARPGGDAPTRTRTGLPRTPLLRVALAIPLLLVLSTVALAATGVIRIGAPAEKGSRFAPPLRGGGLVKGTVRLLQIATPDPAGGPPWGMRVLSTKAGEGCVQVGRLLDGKLGALGRDNAFGDDGQFHEFALESLTARHACTLLDGNGRIFLNATVGDVPASAWAACRAPPPTPNASPKTASHTRCARRPTSATSTTACSAPTRRASRTS
jgi:hypothetical protein